MRVRGICLVLACVGAGSGAFGGTASAQSQVSISSGGEPARHVCLIGAPCATVFAPIALADDDRVEVMAPYTVGATTISKPGGQSARACRRSRNRRAGHPEMPRRWLCAMPDGARGSRQLEVSLLYGPVDATSSQTWSFDVAIVGPGHRATDREARVRFRLAGRYLRLQLIPWFRKPVPDAREELWGKRVTVVCKRRGPGRARRGIRIHRLLWPSGVEATSVRFRRPLGGQPRWCLVEDSTGGDIARARFPRR